MNLFERYLTVWVGLCIIAGVLLGQFLPGVFQAIASLETSEVAAEAFGPEVHQHLVNTARQEWAKANSVVTDWELARNFERI